MSTTGARPRRNRSSKAAPTAAAADATGASAEAAREQQATPASLPAAEAPVAIPPEAPTAIPREAAADSPQWSNVIKGVVAASTVVLVVVVIWRFRSLLQPLIFAAILAYLLNPLVNRAISRYGASRSTAVAIVYGGFILIALGLLAAVGIIAFTQADLLATTLPRLLARLANWFQNDLLNREVVLGPLAFRLGQYVDRTVLTNVAEQALAVAGLSPDRGGEVAAALFSGVLATLSSLFLIMFVAIYLSKDGPMLWASISNVMQAPGYSRDVDRLARETLRIWDSYLRGQVMLGLSMFVLVSITLTILGVNYSLALGGLAGLLEFLPILGPVISTAVAVLVAIFQDSNWLGLPTLWYVALIIVTMVLLQQFEQAVLVPRFVGRALELHALVVIVAVLMGTSLAGVLGAVLAAPVAASVKLVGAYGWRKMFDLPPFPEPERADPGPDTRTWRERLGSMWRNDNSK